MIHVFYEIVEGVALAIDVVASAIMIWAFLVSLFGFLRASVGGMPSERIRRLQIVRCGLGTKLVFALELLIISDLLHTVVSRTMDDLLFLAALVLIRTIVAYFLGREIQEVEAEIDKDHLEN
jgi:uncharacterized membrane protein